MQCPFPSHASPASAHLPPASPPSGMKVHAPEPCAQVWHRPPHGTAQHRPSLHTPASPELTGEQSLGTRHAFPYAHGLQLMPPQSTSVSSPSFFVSLH